MTRVNGGCDDAGSLAHYGLENNIARITGNVLTRVLDPETFQVPASEGRL